MRLSLGLKARKEKSKEKQKAKQKSKAKDLSYFFVICPRKTCLLVNLKAAIVFLMLSKFR